MTSPGAVAAPRRVASSGAGGRGRAELGHRRGAAAAGRRAWEVRARTVTGATKWRLLMGERAASPLGAQEEATAHLRGGGGGAVQPGLGRGSQSRLDLPSL